jgi:hypothetical protein
MPITAVPQGVELRKLSAVQKRAVDDLLQKQRESNLLETTISTAIPALAFAGVGGAAILVAYSYLNDLKLPTAKEVAKAVTTAAGEVVSDVVIDVGGAVAKAAGFEDNPTTPEYLPSGTGPLTRCTRWATDAVEVLGRVQSGKLSNTEKVQAALATKRIIKNMKAEGCDRPSAISIDQWEA